MLISKYLGSINTIKYLECLCRSSRGLCDNYFGIKTVVMMNFDDCLKSKLICIHDVVEYAHLIKKEHEYYILMDLACAYGSLRVAKILLQYTHPFGHFVLRKAVSNNQTQIIKWMSTIWNPESYSCYNVINAVSYLAQKKDIQAIDRLMLMFPLNKNYDWHSCIISCLENNDAETALHLYKKTSEFTDEQFNSMFFKCSTPAMETFIKTSDRFGWITTCSTLNKLDVMTHFQVCVVFRIIFKNFTKLDNTLGYLSHIVKNEINEAFDIFVNHFPGDMLMDRVLSDWKMIEKIQKGPRPVDLTDNKWAKMAVDKGYIKTYQWLMKHGATYNMFD